MRKYVRYGGATSRATSAPCYGKFVESKAAHPRHVALIRIGDFYETMGTDAVLLVERAGLNPMAPDSGVPRAGCPVPARSPLHRPPPHWPLPHWPLPHRPPPRTHGLRPAARSPPSDLALAALLFFKSAAPQALRRTLHQLVSAGLSVAVWEEAPAPPTPPGGKARNKNRFLAGPSRLLS